MSKQIDVLPGEAVESAWGNAIRDRTVQRYTNLSDRTTTNPAPVEGDLSYLEDADKLSFYDGAAWVDVLDAVNNVYVSAFGGSFVGVINTVGIDNSLGDIISATFRDTTSQFRTLNGLVEANIFYGSGGSVAEATFGFGTIAGGIDRGMYSTGGAHLNWSIAATEALRLSASQLLHRDGLITAPGISFIGANNTGWYRSGGNLLTAISGVQVATENATRGPGFPTMLSTGSAANVNASGGSLVLATSTSSLAYKSHVKKIPLATARTAVAALRPISFRSKHEGDKTREETEEGFVNDFYGFGAEDVADAMPEAFEPDNYDLRAVVAVLVRVVQDLIR